MATSPQFASTPQTWATWIYPTAGAATAPAAVTLAGLQGSTQNSRSGGTTAAPTGAVLLMAAGTSGSRIDEITFTSLGTSVANVGRIFIYNTTNTNYYLYKEISIPAVTASTSVPSATVTATFSNFLLSSGDSVYVSVATLDSGYAVNAFGGDF